MAAQHPAKVPQAGFLWAEAPASFLDAFREGMRNAGYIEAQSIVIHQRWALGCLDRLPELAAEVVRLKADVIVAASIPAVLSAKMFRHTAVYVDKILKGANPGADRAANPIRIADQLEGRRHARAESPAVRAGARR